MQRDPALHDLARDHYRVLLMCRRVEKATASERASLVEPFLRFWDEDATFHLLEEEALLVPHLPPDDADRVRGEHEWLRAAVERLRASPDPEAFAELARRLREHVRDEDRVLYGKVERALTAAQRAELRLRSAEFRLRVRPKGLEHCSLPHAARS